MREASPGEDPLIDRAHLDAQTFGDGALARELVGLFVEQCRRLVPGIGDPALPAAERADLAHTLKGSALGIGARRVAVLASDAEARLRAGGPDALGRADALGEAVAATLAALDAGA